MEVLDVAVLQDRASAIARILDAIANERRLRLLCRLASTGEATVTELAGDVGLSASATSQHLGRMREEAIVTFRKEGRTFRYRVADTRIDRLLATLQHLFCTTPADPQPKD